jgi:hypothetical protein
LDGNLLIVWFLLKVVAVSNNVKKNNGFDHFFCEVIKGKWMEIQPKELSRDDIIQG